MRILGIEESAPNLDADTGLPSAHEDTSSTSHEDPAPPPPAAQPVSPVSPSWARQQKLGPLVPAASSSSAGSKSSSMWLLLLLAFALSKKGRRR